MIYLLIYLLSVAIMLLGVYNYNKEGKAVGAPDRFSWDGWWPKTMVFMPGLNTLLLVAGVVFYVLMTIYYFGR